MNSRTTQRAVTGGVFLLAIGALVLATVYQANTSDPREVNITGNVTVPAGELPVATTLPISPIEQWFPATGEGTTCREPVGVDLIPGFEAILTINGQLIEPDEMNPPDSAGRSLGHFTWGPEDGCPRSGLLRPENNTVEACVYVIVDGPDNCVTAVTTFNAL